MWGVQVFMLRSLIFNLKLALASAGQFSSCSYVTTTTIIHPPGHGYASPIKIAQRICVLLFRSTFSFTWQPVVSYDLMPCNWFFLPFILSCAAYHASIWYPSSSLRSNVSSRWYICPSIYSSGSLSFMLLASLSLHAGVIRMTETICSVMLLNRDLILSVHLPCPHQMGFQRFASVALTIFICIDSFRNSFIHVPWWWTIMSLHHV